MPANLDAPLANNNEGGYTIVILFVTVTVSFQVLQGANM